MHVHVAGRDQRHRELAAEISSLLQPAPVVARVQELHGHPEAAFEALLEPTPRSRIGGVIRKARQPQQQAMRLQAIGDVVALSGIRPWEPRGALD